MNDGTVLIDQENRSRKVGLRADEFGLGSVEFEVPLGHSG